MKRINRKINMLIVLVLSAASLWGCTGGQGEPAADGRPGAAAEAAAGETVTGKSPGIVTTGYPQYDFVRQILGDNPAGMEVTYLLGSGVDMHNYQPSADDIIKIRTSDLFLYIGGESDQWVDTLIGQVREEAFHPVALVDIVEMKEEKIVEGMEHDHDHDDGHDHSQERTIFEDDEVKDRSLSDWAGEWQSVYPYLLDHSLDSVMAHKAAGNSGQSAEEYYQYYENGYRTDTDHITIAGNTMEFFSGGESVKAEYEYKGYRIFTYESGSKGVRYQFEALQDNGAPRYIQFSDHMIGPAGSLHYHIYMGNEGFDTLSEELENWPTYYPAEMSGDEIADEMLHHDQGHSEEDHDHDLADDSEAAVNHDHSSELDEHVWLSLKNAEVLVTAICDEITALDPTHAELYKANAAAYIDQIKDLDSRYAEVVEHASRRTILVADRFPFRYLADDYGLDYYAAFPGCSAETEASFDTVVFLAEKVSELELPAVFRIEGSSGKIAETVISSSAQKEAGILVLNSIQSVSTGDIESGVSYLGLMEENLNQLKEALN